MTASNTGEQTEAETKKLGAMTGYDNKSPMTRLIFLLAALFLITPASGHSPAYELCNRQCIAKRHALITAVHSGVPADMAEIRGLKTIASSSIRISWFLRECGFGLTFRPLDQQPFFRAPLGEILVAMGDTDAYPGKARGQLFGGAFAPRDRAPRF
jgi:hypothetical protein